eukprot:9147599-Pyramimonas_sp.AAC.1
MLRLGPLVRKTAALVEPSAKPHSRTGVFLGAPIEAITEDVCPQCGPHRSQNLCFGWDRARAR